MNSLIVRLGVATAALCGLVLAGCNAIEDVRDDTTTPVPTPTVVLGGKILGAGIKRPVLLSFNGGTPLPFAAPTSLQATPDPSVANFDFGAVPVGSSYTITVAGQPYGKECSIDHPSGTITTQAALSITVTCSNITNPANPRYVPRYDVQVQLPATGFIGTPNAKVTLSTEDGLFEKVLAVASNVIDCGPNKCVRFDDAIAGNATFRCTPAITNGAPCAPTTLKTAVAPTGVVFGYNPVAFDYVVAASNTTGGTLNRCKVNNSSLPLGTAGTIAETSRILPTADITNVVVERCTFTVSGTVSYSRPNGVTVDPPMGTGGVTLALRSAAGADNVPGAAPATVTSYVAGSNGFTLTTAGVSNTTFGLMDVIITQHPAGQRCVVDGSSPVNLYIEGVTANPSDQVVKVFCRTIPTGTSLLRGLYRLTSQTYQANSSTNPLAAVEWVPLSATRQNIAPSDLLAFFEDGTFLYGTHGVTSTAIIAQVENGFYDYDPVARTVRFSLITDTNPRPNFGVTTQATNISTGVTTYTFSAFAAAVNRTATPGLSGNLLLAGAPASSTTLTPASPVYPTVLMSNVQFGTVPTTQTDPSYVLPDSKTMSGTFGTLSTTTPKLDWVLTEPPSLPNEWTGTWVSQDHRRLFVWDLRTLYGMHVGVNGGSANLQNVCLSTDDLHASFGLYVRRAAATGCYPVNRPFPGQSPAYIATSFEAPDAPLSATTASGGNSLGVVTALPAIPGFVGRIPGGVPQFDGRPPNPTYFLVAPAVSFATNPRQDLFPAPSASVPYATDAFTTWCSSDVLGSRATLGSGAPTDYPAYFCRYRVAP